MISLFSVGAIQAAGPGPYPVRSRLPGHSVKPRRCSVLCWLACFFAIGTTASAAETQEAPSGADVTIVEGQVVFEGGAALEGVMVFCIDGATSLVVAAANSDHDGRVSLTVPAGHQLV